MKPHTTIEIPKAMRTLERDPRGYPIPFNVMRDSTGKPHFTITDHAKVIEAARKKLCGLSGKKLTNGAWFVGGPRCFIHPQGAFTDGPMLEECARYALKVCPYIAAPSYGRRIEARTLSGENTLDGMAVVLNEAVNIDRPDCFCLGVTASFRLVESAPGQMVFVAGKWETLSFWRHGAEITDEAEIRRIIAASGT